MATQFVRLIPRFTVRRLMVLVAVVAFGLGYHQALQRWKDFRSRAEYHFIVSLAYQAEAEAGWAGMSSMPDLSDPADPESAPFEPGTDEAWKRENARAMAEYHVRMGNYWRSRW